MDGPPGTTGAPHTGTTVVAVSYAGGVVIGADSRVSTGKPRRPKETGQARPSAWTPSRRAPARRAPTRLTPPAACAPAGTYVSTARLTRSPPWPTMCTCYAPALPPTRRPWRLRWAQEKGCWGWGAVAAGRGCARGRSRCTGGRCGEAARQARAAARGRPLPGPRCCQLLTAHPGPARLQCATSLSSTRCSCRRLQACGLWPTWSRRCEGGREGWGWWRRGCGVQPGDGGGLCFGWPVAT